MFFKSILSTALISLASVAHLSNAADLPAIEIGGNKFFYSNNGSQFYMKGVAYQKDNSNSTDLTFVDPLADEDTCSRDIPYLQELGTNVIRVYAVNASLDHDACMKKLNDAGIYVIADLAEPGDSIITTSPAWTLDLYERYTNVIDMFSNYTNVLGFFAGNEVITNTSNTDAAPFVKAAIRDMKQYMSDQDYRDIPIGYSANDDSDTRAFSADYFACGDEDVQADFYGINMYEWCGNSNFASSGYKSRTEEFKNLTVPVFFSEYGCNAVQPRKFTEVKELYSDDMTDVWSGGIVYMYFEEENNYGLVSVNGDKVKTLSDFNNLKSQIAAIKPTSATYQAVTKTATTMECPATNSDWSAATKLPPTPEKDVCDCMMGSLGCVVGDDVDSDDYSDLYSYACAKVDCSDISSNGTSGKYGTYSFCSSKAKLSYVFNKYYEKQGSSKSACDFSGSASLQSTSTASTCSSVLANATKSGGVSNATGTGSSDSSSGSGSGSGSESGSASGSSSGSSSSSSSSSTSTSKSGAGSVVKTAANRSELAVLAFAATCLAGGFSFLFI